MTAAHARQFARFVAVFVLCAVKAYTDERIDPNGGTQCFGMHCCPSGYAMRGVHVDQNRLLCRKVNEGADDCFLDFPTQRQGMHACPSGTYMRGIHVGDNVLTCCYDRMRGYSELFGEFADTGHQEENMHACPLRADDTYMTGIHVGQNRFLCANAVSPPSPRRATCSPGRSASC